MNRRSNPAAVALALLLVGASAGASELDGLAFLSWSPTAVVDTLAVAGAGSHDLWLLVRADEAPARFIEAVGEWHFGPGLVPTGLEVLTSGTPIGSFAPGADGVALVRIGDFDCRRGADLLAVARLKVAIEPALFPGGAAGVVPSRDGTRLSFADYDPEWHCLGVWDFAVIGPVTALDAALPAGATSFGALKARYR
ncbi:MAG: hypothetical protein R6X35_16155 [Candidatus Krumholzibacteriia bacterium]